MGVHGQRPILPQSAADYHLGDIYHYDYEAVMFIHGGH